MESKADKLIWWLMITFMGIIITCGGAWAYNVNSKIDKINGLEANVQSIQSDIAAIKNLFLAVVKEDR